MLSSKRKQTRKGFLSEQLCVCVSRFRKRAHAVTRPKNSKDKQAMTKAKSQKSSSRKENKNNGYKGYRKGHEGWRKREKDEVLERWDMKLKPTKKKKTETTH